MTTVRLEENISARQYSNYKGLESLTQRWTHLLAKILDETAVLHIIHEIQKYFDCREDHSGIGVR
jgi:hypothetical protein